MLCEWKSLWVRYFMQERIFCSCSTPTPISYSSLLINTVIYQWHFFSKRGVWSHPLWWVISIVNPPSNWQMQSQRLVTNPPTSLWSVTVGCVNQPNRHKYHYNRVISDVTICRSSACFSSHKKNGKGAKNADWARGKETWTTFIHWSGGVGWRWTLDK